MIQRILRFPSHLSLTSRSHGIPPFLPLSLCLPLATPLQGALIPPGIDINRVQGWRYITSNIERGGGIIKWRVGSRTPDRSLSFLGTTMNSRLRIIARCLTLMLRKDVECGPLSSLSNFHVGYRACRILDVYLFSFPLWVYSFLHLLVLTHVNSLYVYKISRYTKRRKYRRFCLAGDLISNSAAVGEFWRLFGPLAWIIS